MKTIILVLCTLFGSVASAATINFLSYEDLETGDVLETAREYVVDLGNASDLGVTFREFLEDSDKIESFCFEGKAKEAVKIAEAILDYATGDSAILTSKFKVQKDVIEHVGTYTEGSGDYDFELDFTISRCE